MKNGGKHDPPNLVSLRGRTLRHACVFSAQLNAPSVARPRIPRVASDDRSILCPGKLPPPPLRCVGGGGLKVEGARKGSVGGGPPALLPGACGQPGRPEARQPDVRQEGAPPRRERHPGLRRPGAPLTRHGRGAGVLPVQRAVRGPAAIPSSVPGMDQRTIGMPRFAWDPPFPIPLRRSPS